MTSMKKIDGFLATQQDFKKVKITVHYSCDKLGKTLSLEYEGKVMLTVPFEEIENIVKETKK